MLRLKFSIELNYEIDQPGCDFIFSIDAAQTPHQIVVGESLNISQSLPSNMYTDPVTHTRFLRLKAFAGPLTVRYDATVDLDHHTAQPSQLGEVAVANLSGTVLPYVYPSRYCQSDRLYRLAIKEFGQLQQGYGRVQAIRDWVMNRVSFISNSSTGNTSAVDTLVEEVGVCRDFAHLNSHRKGPIHLRPDAAEKNLGKGENVFCFITEHMKHFLSWRLGYRVAKASDSGLTAGQPYCHSPEKAECQQSTRCKKPEIATEMKS